MKNYETAHAAGGRPYIQVQGLRYTYMKGTGFEVHALRGVDFEVRRGECVGLIGRSGSGKSTLLFHLNGLLRPEQGRVVVGGVSLGGGSADITAVRRRIGLVFQRPETQLFERFAGDDVAFGPRRLGMDAGEVREAVRGAMDQVGLDFETFKDRLTAELSGGEKRRLALAGILAMGPEVLVLDEPTAGIDPAGRREVQGILHRWSVGGTMILVSHDLEEVAELCSRVYVMAEGRMRAQGPAAEILSDVELMREQGLGMPFTVRFFHELGRSGIKARVGLYSLQEAAQRVGELIGTGGS